MIHVCCKCFHRGRLFVCAKCGHRECTSCKERPKIAIDKAWDGIEISRNLSDEDMDRIISGPGLEVPINPRVHK